MHFPEGNMTFGGETGELHGTTARLVKRTGAALVTYRGRGYLPSLADPDSDEVL